MKAVILAAGKSTRTYPLTLTKPKPLLKVGKKTLLEHNLDQLNGLVNEVILVVGYKADMIKAYFGNSYKKLKLSYAKQREQLGTGHALLQVKNKVKDRFVVLMGDDLYSKDDIKKCLKYRCALLAKEVKDPSNFGVIMLVGNKVKNIIEKPALYVSNLANCALYVFDKKIFDELEKLKKSKRGEYEIIDAVKELGKKEDIICVKAKQWTPVVYTWDLFKVKKLFGIKGNAVGENSRINGEVRNSIIMDDVIIAKGSKVQDSIIGNKVRFKGKIISKDNAVSIVKRLPRNAGRLGAIIGDNVVGGDVTIYPGVKIWPNKKIRGIIKKDIQ